MKVFQYIGRGLLVTALVLLASCEERLSEMNVNPNGVDPQTANPNMLMPTVMTGLATNYLNLGYGDIAGVVQHTQKDGWYTGHNSYDWGPQDWSGWYGLLRNNDFLYQRAKALDFPFHQGVALTMRACLFGMVTDLWGDAPYTQSLQGNAAVLLPAFDSQEVIYKGIIEDLKAASTLFATRNTNGLIANYDVYYKGNAELWQKFANSLLLRYYLRVSAKMPELAKAGVESVYQSGIYLKSASEDATMAYIGASSGDSWPTATSFDAGSNFRRLKPAQPFLQKLVGYQDPRLTVWFSPVHVQWVADATLATAADEFIRKDGVIQPGVRSLTDAVFLAEKAKGHVYTRHYNPARLGRTLDTNTYVGLPVGMLRPDTHNYNPTEGQTLENQHVSQLAPVYRERNAPLLKARLLSAAEVHFILAEAALKGWQVGDAAGHYNAGVQQSLNTWGVGDRYAAYIQQPGVAYQGSLAQVMEQKWIASWTAATEAWFDFRRTGLPALLPGPASPEPVVPVRFNYGDNELNFNAGNANQAITNLEQTPYSGLRGRNSPWSKPWIVKGTGKPW